MRSPGYNYTINGFRGICILLIFLFHIEQSKIIPDVPSLGIWWKGFLYFVSSFKYGVELFFMISGYVIIGSLRKHATVDAFLVDRVLRLYPAWIPVHILLFIFGTLIGRDFFAHIDAAHWIFYFLTDLFFLPPTFLPVPMAHMGAWSLSYEWIFYLLAAGSVVIAHSRAGKSGSIIITIVGALVMINLFPRGLFFVSGVAAALNEERIKRHAHFFRFPLVCLMLFLLAWHATGADRAEVDTMLIEWAQDSRILFAALAFGLGTYLFICIMLGKGWLSEKLNTPLFQFFGKISYSFYLWSVIVMYPVKRVALAYITPLAGPWGAAAFFAIFSMTFAVLVSWTSWYYLEGRLTRVLRKQLQMETATLRLRISPV